MGGLAHNPTLTANSSQSDTSEYKRALELNEKYTIEWHGYIYPKGLLKRIQQISLQRPNPYTKQRLAQQNAQKPRASKRLRKNAKAQQELERGE